MSRRAGFSLIELIMVLLITSLLAAIAIPRFSRSSEEYRVESAARRIESDLQYAREHARLTSSAVTVTFDVNSNEYGSTDIPDIDHPGQPYVVELVTDPYRVNLTSSSFAGTGSITFDGYGEADLDHTLHVTAGQASRTVEVVQGVMVISSP